jgi:Spy/CpxP family protein refolding chaperone
MTATVIRRIALGVGAGIVALGVTAGVYASAQNTNQDPPPFRGPGGPGRPGGPGGPGRFGGPGGPGMPGGPMGMLPMLAPRLGLTDAQKDQVKHIAESHKDEWKALADRGRTAHEALNDAVTAEGFDEALIRSRSAEIGFFEADMAVARARAHAEVFQILTAEQKTQMKTMQAAMKNRMQGRQEGRRARRGRLLERFGL